MIIEQRQWNAVNGWKTIKATTFDQSPQLVLAFGSTEVLAEAKRFE